MSDHAQFDRNTLAALKPGMDAALAEISTQMEAYLATPGEKTAALEAARSELHSLLGVLKMAGLDGAAVFCAELELTLSEIATNPKQISLMHRDVLRRALFGITHFLDSLAKGADNATLRLFTQYQELQQLRGMEMSFDLDLFFPNLDIQLPKPVLDLPVQADAKARLKALRGQYQQGLLKWMRQEDPAASAQQMQKALEGALRCVSQDARRAFWWVACGLLECVRLDAIPEEMNVRKLLSRIDQQMRAVAEGKGGDEQPVMNEMLYLIGRSQAESEHVAAIRQVYALDAFLPELSALSPNEVDQMLVAMHDQLRVAEECWEQCTQGDAAACGKFAKYAEQVALQSDKLDRDVLQYLSKQIQILSQYATTPDHAKPIAMDMAMALLLLGSGIENYRRIGSSFQEQARILTERMQAAVKQQPEDPRRLTELVDLHYQMEQRGDVMSPLVSEMLINLQHVEQGLNAFFNKTIKPDELPELLRLLNQIQGGLHISSLQHAEQLLAAIQKKIVQITQTDAPQRPAERYALADAMSALENYMQYLVHGQAGDASRLQSALADLIKSDQPEPAPSQPEQPTAPAPAAATPVDLAPPDSAGDALEFEPSERAQPATAPDEPEPSRAEVPATPIPLDILPDTLDITPIKPVQVVEVPDLSVPLEVPVIDLQARPVSASPSRSDEEQELLDIFLEESQEVLETMRGNLGTCLSNPGNYDALVAIRRGFHTLKGSGRMVGLNDLGEVAWCVERAMNKWLQDNKQATPGLLEFIRVAIQAFSGWVETLRGHGDPVIEAADLIASAQQIEDGLEATLAEPQVGAGHDETTEAAAGPALELPGLEIESIDIAADTAPPEPVESLPGMTAGSDEFDTPALFNIASAEVRQNLAVLHQQLDALRGTAPSQIKYDFMRAAHTLAGVSRTMEFAALVELSAALEGWLQARLEKTFTLSDVQFDMLEQAIVALDGMIQSLGGTEIPQERDDLVKQLRTDKDKLGDVIEDQSGVEFEPIADIEPVPEAESIPDSEPLEALPDLMLPDAAPQMEPTEPAAGDLTVQAETDTGRDEPDQAVPAPAKAAQSVLQPVTLTVAKSTESYVEPDKPRVFDEVDDQLLPVFLEEAEDLCPQISEGLRAWRETPQDEQQVPLLKRLLHTMKGSSRMVGAMRIGEIAHEMEDRVLAAPQMRDEADYWDTLENDFDRILALIEELRGGKPADEPKPVPTGRRATDQPAGVERRAERRALEPGAERAMLGNMLRVRADVVDRLVNEAGEISVARSRMEAELRVLKDNLLELTDSVMRLRQQLREVEIQAESQMQARVSLAKDNSEQFDPLEFDRFTRLQELTRFMHESVHDVHDVQQTMLKNLEEASILMLAQGRLNTELQQGLMNVRMVSFNSIADRLYRIVRQTGKELGKRANLELQGINVELDRSVLEKMVAPFEHLLRNSIVHGLETDEQRKLNGKLPIGEIRLSVRQENNEVVFEFSDDGAGLNYAKLREKALASGSIQEGEEVNEDQLAQTIFTPGLSTAAEITEIAGRGIGMDVVRSEISALGGRIEVSSKRGAGTQFLIHLPLTLAVTQILMVRSGEKVYAIPSTMVEQVRQVKSADMDSLHHNLQIEWQNNTYALHYLPYLLANTEAVQQNLPRTPVLLLRSGDQRVALQVDELLGNHEVMVKNIGPQLARLPGIAGAAVLGDGRVVLILNPVQLAQRSSFASRLTLFEPSNDTPETSPATAIPGSGIKSQSGPPLIMVVDDSLTVRKITSRMLIRAGYQVVTANDGIDALEKLEGCMPDVMLLDIEMPRMDGFTLAKELRRKPQTHDLPIIMITSRTADKHREYAMQLGVNTYMGKPYQEDDLLQNIADFVAVHKLDA